MSTATLPLRIDPKDRQQLRALAEESGHTINDVVSLALRKGLPLARAALCPLGRLTNVEPLDDAALDRCYGDGPQEQDEVGVQRFMAAQSFGGAD